MSAQMAELWALWRESRFIYWPQHVHLSRSWTSAMQACAQRCPRGP